MFYWRRINKFENVCVRLYVRLCWLCPQSSRSSYTIAMFLLRTGYDLTLPVQSWLCPYSSCSFCPYSSCSACPYSSCLEMAMSLLYYVHTKRYFLTRIKLTITCSQTRIIKYCILPQRHCSAKHYTIRRLFYCAIPREKKTRSRLCTILQIKQRT